MYKVCSKNKMETSDWSGGKTSQIYISPEDCVFGKDKFDFRISLATVEKEETFYTSFPGVMRNLLVVEGKITLVSKNEARQLNPGDNYIFSGSDHLECFGTSTNFNLMYDDNKFKTKLIIIDNAPFSFKLNRGFSVVFPLSGGLELKTRTNSVRISETEYWISKNEDFEITSLRTKTVLAFIYPIY